MSICKQILTFSLVLGIALPAIADNVLLNPGFESGQIAPWQEVWLGDDENDPPAPLWSVASWPSPWGAPEGDFFALTYDSDIAIYQAIEPTPVSQITAFSFQTREQILMGGEYFGGLVCHFEDPAGEVDYIQNIAEIPVGEEEWLMYDGLADLQSLAALVEGVGPEGPRLIGVGFVGSPNASSNTDDWTLVVPEPSGFALLGLGSLALLRRRRTPNGTEDLPRHTKYNASRLTAPAIMIGLLLAMSSSASADTILENPGFESGDIEPWQHYQFIDPDIPTPPPAEETWYISDSNPHSGNYCAAGVGSNYIFQQQIYDVELALEDVVEFSVWVRQEYEPEYMFPLLDLQFDDDPYDLRPGIGVLSGLPLNGDEWTYYDGMTELQSAWSRAERILGPGTQLISVGIMGFFPDAGEAPNPTYVDDWALTVPEPASLLMVGLSGGILLRRQRT